MALASPRVGSGMLERIKGLTEVGAMTRMLHEIVAYERSIDGDLDQFLAQRHDLDAQLASVRKSGEILELVAVDAEQMVLSVQKTRSLADLVSGKVRELDRAQSRVQETLARIDVIVDRGNCIDGAKQALAAEDYEAAAKFVERFLQLDQKMGPALDSASGDQKSHLLESKKKLEDVIRKKLSAAMDSGDHPSVLRFASLYAPLGLHEEGLKSFVLGYLKKRVASRARDSFDSLKKNVEQADFVAAVNAIFNDIGAALEDNEELIRNLGGEDGIVFAIKELQEECDSRGSVVIRKYMEHRNLGKLEKEIAAQSKAVIAVAIATPEGPDPRSIEIYLEEMLLLLQTSEDYTQFMIGRLKEAGSSGAQLSPRAASSFRTGVFSRALQELTNYYLVLEEFFLIENVKKAIKLDEPVPSASITSVVEDVFCVLRSCTERAISTLNLHLALSVVNCAVNVLNNEYKEALQRKMREPNLALRLFAGGSAVAKVGVEISAAVNNMDVSAEYVGKLKSEIETRCTEIFPTPAEQEKLKSCLLELGETSTSMRQVANAGVEQLSGCIIPRLRTFLDSVSTVAYEITDAQYADNEMNDPWVQKLLHAVETNVKWLQPHLTTNNYDTLVHHLVDFIVKRLEAIMNQKHFNQLGGLQLDRDVRTLVSHFSNMTQRTVRDKFARLAQMATILNLEKVSEILDYWGENSGPMTWRLTPAEVRKVLQLRVDFKTEAIAALKL